VTASQLVAFVTAAVLVVAAWMVALRSRLELRAHRARYPHTAEDLVVARRDSVARSHAVVNGKVREHLAPLFPEFLGQFSARDARFLGSPVDFVVFDGLDEGRVERVVFVEVKTGSAALSARERRVREAVEDGRIEWQVVRLPGVPVDDDGSPARLPRTRRTAG
jgi:predicted Holliday junction resolvase-like endonuclease